MSEFLTYMPCFAPNAGVEEAHGRPFTRLSPPEIAERINTLGERSRARPYVYMDAIDSIIGQRPDIDLVVADARSSDIVREGLSRHHKEAGGYKLTYYPQKESQWKLFNDVLERHATMDTKYFIYTSSDIIWAMDWIGEAVKEFERDPQLQILFPTVSGGDMAIPVQLARGPVDADLIDPKDHMGCIGMAAARAPCLNAYAFIMRMDFLRMYGGYMNAYSNCFSESFLYYQCEAMAGKMRLAPRCWCFHHSAVDVWVDATGFYGYTAEKPTFDAMMDKVLDARQNNEMTIPFLKKILYRNPA